MLSDVVVAESVFGVPEEVLAINERDSTFDMGLGRHLSIWNNPTGGSERRVRSRHSEAFAPVGGKHLSGSRRMPLAFAILTA